ncbi:MAG TPA: TonB family protein [Chthoniobacterales bacterium]
MPRDARFWRNVAIITVAHLAIVLALARGDREPARANLETVVWMNSEATAAAEPRSTPAPPPREEKPAESPVAAIAKSEIQMPSPTPTPTTAPKPSPTPTPKSSPKPTAKPTPKATPKKSVEPKVTPKPTPRKEKDDSEKKSATPKKESSPSSSNQSSGKTENPGKGSGSGTTQPSEFAWYGTMLHDRFHKAWEQPKSIVATGAKMSTIVKIRIERDGRVSKFAIVKPSGNVVVDESVAAIAQRVTQVDPLPEGLAKGAYYEVKIDFELNAEQ